MKKFWKVTAMTLALACSFASFAGCEKSGSKDDEPAGEIKGNYKEVTDEALLAQLDKIGGASTPGTPDAPGGDTAGGSTATATTASGVKLDWLFDVGVKFGKAKGSVKSTGNAQAYMGGTEEAPEMAAKLSTKNTAKINKEFLQMDSPASSTVQYKDVDAYVNAECYLDYNYLYADIDAKMNGLEGVAPEGTQTSFDSKIKISTADIFGMIGDLMTMTTSEEENESAELMAKLTMLKTTFAIAVTADISDKGFKLKMATTEETAMKIEAYIAALATTQNEETLAMLAMAKWSNCDAEVYVEFDTNGMFIGAAANLDVTLTVEGIPGYTGQKLTVDMEFKGGVYASDEKVTLPADLATDTTYQEFDLDNLPF